MLVVTLGDHPLIVGKGAIDQFRGQHHVIKSETNLGVGKRNRDIHLVVLDKLAQLGHRLAWHDDAGHVRRAVGLGRLHAG